MPYCSTFYILNNHILKLGCLVVYFILKQRYVVEFYET